MFGNHILFAVHLVEVNEDGDHSYIVLQYLNKVFTKVFLCLRPTLILLLETPYGNN